MGKVVDSVSSLAQFGISNYANDKASDDLFAANNDYLKMIQSQYDQQRSDQAPWLQRGQQANDLYSQILGLGKDGTAEPNADPNRFNAFFQSPDYNFAMGQGTQAVERSAAARGLLGSGSTLKSLNAFGQGLASQQYGNYMNRLAGLSGQGQNSAQSLAGVSNAFQQNYGQGLFNKGNIQASEHLGVGAALGQGAQDASDIWGSTKSLFGSLFGG